MQKNIFELLRADGSIVVNKKLANTIGLQEAVLYSELVSKYLYWQGKGKLKQLELFKDKKTKEITYSEEFFFYCTIEDLEESTTLSRKQQKSCIDKLMNLKLITYMVKQTGTIKTARYFSINLDTNLILSFLGSEVENDEFKNDKKTVSTFGNTGNVQKGHSGESKRDIPERPKGTPNNTNLNNTQENKDNDDTETIPLQKDEKNGTKVPNHDHQPQQPVEDSSEKDLKDCNQEIINKLVAGWNTISKRPVKLITENRTTKLQQIIKALGKESVLSVIDVVGRSEYAVVNLEFTHMIKDVDTFVEILEGKYDKRETIVKEQVVKNNSFNNLGDNSHNWDLQELEDQAVSYAESLIAESKEQVESIEQQTNETLQADSHGRQRMELDDDMFW